MQLYVTLNVKVFKQARKLNIVDFDGGVWQAMLTFPLRVCFRGGSWLTCPFSHRNETSE